MAVTQSRRPSLILSRLHFALRFLGLTGALAAAVGLALLRPSKYQDCYTPLTDPLAEPLARAASSLFVGGAAVFALLLLVEAVVIVRIAAARRSAFGFNAVLQIALAGFLLVVVNLISAGFSVQLPSWLHKEDGSRTELSMKGRYARFDLTRGRQFSLPPDLEERLRQLDPKQQTRIVVYQQHKTFSGLTTKPDRYDYSAERKVVEKIRDLVELMREAGPRFQVEVLDVEDEGFDAKLERIKLDSPELFKAIDSAAENSIFLASAVPGRTGQTHIQQMSFNELYQLDRVRSKQGQRNLVLLGQGEGRGVRPFVNRILNIERRPPRVGVLVVHEELTTAGSDRELSLAGLKKVLERSGYEIRDVVTKKGWGGGARLESAADTIEESKLERLESELESVEEDVKELEEEIGNQGKDTLTLAKLSGQERERKIRQMVLSYSGRLIQGELNARTEKAVLGFLTQVLEQRKEELESKRTERQTLLQEKNKLNLDWIRESQRLGDVKAKLTYTTADCDLLLIARLTRLSNNVLINPRYHRLDAEQASVLREFLKSGKPVLACVGPINEADDDPRMTAALGPPGPDEFERLLGELGFKLGKHTVLFPTDSRAFAERRRGPTGGTSPVEIPPIDFDRPARDGYSNVTGEELPDNPLRKSLRVTARSVEKGFDLRMRFPRPIYLESVGKKPEYDATFLLTSTGWNEEQPFVRGGRGPRFTPPKEDDPDRNTAESKRRGPFPVGAAAEVSLPRSWDAPKDRKTRVVVVGQGDVFTGTELHPARERLLLQTTNWLLGRDDALPSDENEWKYPRLMYEQGSWEHYLWLLGACVGLPALFAFTGVVVLMYRRLR